MMAINNQDDDDDEDIGGFDDDAPGHLLDLPLVRVPHRRGGLGQGGVVLHRDQVGQGGEGGELTVVPEFDRVVVLCKHDHLVFNSQWMFDCEEQLPPPVGGRRSHGRMMRTMMKIPDVYFR